jgi:hypothetical protein
VKHKHKNSMISENCFVGAGSSQQWAHPTTEAITEVGSADQVGSGEVATITVEARDFDLFEFFFFAVHLFSCVDFAVVELELECL